jgi:DNA-directed RNA polymerase subunit F
MSKFKSFDPSKVKNTFKFIVKNTSEIFKKIANISNDSIKDVRSIFFNPTNKSKDQDLKKKIVNNLKQLKLLKKPPKYSLLRLQ